MKKFAILAFALMVCVPHAAAYAIENGSDATGTGAETTTRSSLATYEGRTIDLRKSWGSAEACYVTATATHCFDSEKEMDQFIAATDPEVLAPASHGWARRAVCSSTLRLYDVTSYNSQLVALNLRGSVIDLSTYGVDNRTTSYKVGACSATFWQGAGATGTVYPGNTAAGAQFPNMVTGWNDTISSVFIG
jgi:hypothetical protein